jgi:hypothetical protein
VPLGKCNGVVEGVWELGVGKPLLSVDRPSRGRAGAEQEIPTGKGIRPPNLDVDPKTFAASLVCRERGCHFARGGISLSKEPVPVVGRVTFFCVVSGSAKYCL